MKTAKKLGINVSKKMVAHGGLFVKILPICIHVTQTPTGRKLPESEADHSRHSRISPCFDRLMTSSQDDSCSCQTVMLEPI